MEKYKNTLLTVLVVLSQIHVLFRGMDYDFVWKVRGEIIEKSVSFSAFLLSHHLTSLILLFLLYKLSSRKKLTLYLLILSFLDVVYFIAFSGFGYGLEKIVLSLLTYSLILKLKEWRK